MPSSGSDPDPALRADLVDLARVAKEPLPVELAVRALRGTHDGPPGPGTIRNDLERVVASAQSLRSIATGTEDRRIAIQAEADEVEDVDERGRRSRAAKAMRRLIAACRDYRAMSPGDARAYALRHLPRHLADAIVDAAGEADQRGLIDELLLLGHDGTFLNAQAQLDPPCEDEATLELAFRTALDHDRPLEAARSIVALAERSAGRETALEAFRAGRPDRALGHLAMLSAAPRLRHALRLALVAQASARDVAMRALSIAREACGVLREVDDPTILDELEMLLPELWELEPPTVLAIAHRAAAPRRDELTTRLAMRLVRTDVQRAIELALVAATPEARAVAVCAAVETYLAHASDAAARDRLPHLVGALQAVDGHGRLADVVGALASLDPGVALDLARSIGDRAARASALADVATTLARSGGPAAAREAADEARVVIDAMDEHPSTTAQVRLGVALIALGDEAEGRSHLVAGLGRVSGPGHHEAKPRSEAARLLVQERRPDLAVEVARASAEPLVRAQVLAAIAPDLRGRTSPEAIAGLLEEGLREAERIGHPTVRASQELRIAGAMAGAAGRGDRALEIVAASLAPASLDALTLRMGGEVASLTEALAATHGPEHAFEVAASIPADDARELVLAGIAEAWSSTDRLPEGLRLAARLHDPARASAFGRLLVATAAEGDMSHVDAVLHAVPDDVLLPSTSVLEAACTLVARGASDRALQVLARRSPRSRLVHPPSATTIVSDARQLIELGRHEAATTLVRTALVDEATRTVALSDCADALAAAGVDERARACIDGARTALGNVRGQHREDTLGALISALARLRDWTAATELADATAPWQRPEAHLAVVRAAIDAAALDAAEAVLVHVGAARREAGEAGDGPLSFHGPTRVAASWSDLAAAFADAGLTDRAVAALRQAADGNVRRDRFQLKAFARAVGCLAAATGREKAAEALEPLGLRESARSTVSVAVVRSLARQGRTGEGLTEALAIDDPNAHALALLHLAHSSFESGSLPLDHPWIVEALHLLEAVNDPVAALLGSRGDDETIQAEIARMLARVGLVDRAFEVVGELRASTGRGERAHLQLAEELATLGQPDAALRAIDEVFPKPVADDPQVGAHLERCAVALATLGFTVDALDRLAAWPEPLERARALEAVGPYLSSPHARRLALDLASRIDRAETRATTQRRLLERFAARDDVSAEELEELLADQDDGSGATIVARAAARQGERSVFGRVAPRVARETGGWWSVVVGLDVMFPEEAEGIAQVRVAGPVFVTPRS